MRVLLIAIVIALIGATARAPAATPVTDVVVDLNHIHKWDDSNGDTWDPFWANDGNLYAFNCDGRGFGVGKGQNLAFNGLSGDSPERLEGKMINLMPEYGASTEKGPDHGTWKALGTECIDSVFYAFVSRHVYGGDSHDPLVRQTAANASLIKSTDKGLTWKRTAAENYAHPMWPGRRFGAPYFIHYGKNGGDVSHDSADRYVYAISNNGFWNDGDDVIIGRVERTRLPRLDASDWTYLASADGSDDAYWSKRIEEAKPIFALPAKCGTTAPCYVPSLGIYLMVVWYNPQMMPNWFNPRRMNYDFYQAGHAWGPWTFVSSCSDEHISGGHWYGPTLWAKFQEQIGADVKLYLFNSGCPFDDIPKGIYKAWEIPILLKTGKVTPSVLINDDDPRIKYSGSWTASRGRKFSDFGDDVHFTHIRGDSLEFTFRGTGIAYVTEKYGDEGQVAVSIDGRPEQTVDLKMSNFPRLSQVTVLETQGLPDGAHTIRIVNTGGDIALVDAFRVYGSATLSEHR